MAPRQNVQRTAGPSRRVNGRDLQNQQRQTGQDGGGKPKSIHDVFEYATEQLEKSNGKGKGKGQQRASRRALANEFDEPGFGRSNVQNDEGEDVDNESDTGGVQKFGTAPMLGDDDDAREIASEDDEEIDSDDAFGEDEDHIDEHLAHHQRSKLGRRKVRRDEIDDDGDSDEDDDDDDDNSQAGSIDDADMVDLSKMLDSDAESDDALEDDNSSSDDDDDENGSSEDPENSHLKLQGHMEAFNKKRNADDAALDASHGADAAPFNGKRRVLQDRTEALPEGDWNAPGRRIGEDALTLDDLMRPISEQAGTSMTSLRNTAKALRPASDASTAREAVASRRGGTTLNAPLPSIVRDRLDRSAAYDETKAEVEGWQPTIKRLREAEHLAFPLQPDPVPQPSTSALASNYKASNSFERDIASLLEREGVTEEQMKQAEELKMNERGMSAEQIRQRTAELRKMRELLFREEQKAKRISKIKSKTYRRIARKQKQREQEKAREAGLLAGDGEGNESDDETRLKAERLRAKERATLKHKNAGKWARGTLGAKGLQDMPEARQAIEEQLQRGEQLRRRVHAERSDDDDEYSEGEDSASDASDEQIRQAAFDEMMSVQGPAAGQQGNEDSGKGILNMKFMRDARNKQAQDAQNEIDAFAEELGESQDEDDEDEDSEGQRKAASMRIGANAGRMVFNVVPQSQTTETLAQPDANVPKKSAVEVPALKGIEVKDVRAPARYAVDASGAEVNPWLVGPHTSSRVSRKKNEAQVSKDASAQSKASNRIQRHAGKQQDARREEEADAELNVDPSAFLALHKGHDEMESGKVASRAGNELASSDDDEDDEEENDVDEPVQVSRQKSTAMQQRQLVAEAFAGDDVLADFTAEKAAAIEADAPQEVDTHLAGWGSWGGKGVRTNKKQAQERKKRFTKWTTGLDPTKRKDAKMQNVIINEKVDKKADRYKSKDVPYPYTSRAQYEMAMRNPLGPEWNTRTQHQRLTLPRVVTKPGKSIKPIEKMF